MRGCKRVNVNIRAASRIGRLLAAAGLTLVVSAPIARAQAKDPAEWIPVSMNAGETYVIGDIKPGTNLRSRFSKIPAPLSVTIRRPANSHCSAPARAAGLLPSPTMRDHEVSYDVNAFGVAKPGAPLTPGQSATVDRR